MTIQQRTEQHQREIRRIGSSGRKWTLHPATTFDDGDYFYNLSEEGLRGCHLYGASLTEIKRFVEQAD